MAAPLLAARRIERIVHEPVAHRPHALVPAVGRTVELDRGAERPARNLEGADQDREHRPRPAARIAPPAVAHPLAEQHRHRSQGQLAAFDLDGLADAGVGEELVRDAARRRGRHVALAFRPFRGVPADVVQEELERGPGFRRLVPPFLAVRPLLHAGRDPDPRRGPDAALRSRRSVPPVPRRDPTKGACGSPGRAGSSRWGRRDRGRWWSLRGTRRRTPRATRARARSGAAARRGTLHRSSAGWGPIPPTPPR